MTVQSLSLGMNLFISPRQKSFYAFLGGEFIIPGSEDDERDDVSEEPQESNTARQDACDPPPQEYLDKIEVKILQRVLFIIFIFTIQTCLSIMDVFLRIVDSKVSCDIRSLSVKSVTTPSQFEIEENNSREAALKLIVLL